MKRPKKMPLVFRSLFSKRAPSASFSFSNKKGEAFIEESIAMRSAKNMNTSASVFSVKETEPNQSSQRNAMGRPISVFESRSSRG